MELKDLELAELPDQARIQCRYTAGGKTGTLWYSVGRQHGNKLGTDRYDGFLVGLLLKAMELGEDIEVHGGISTRLHFNLTHYYMSILSQVIPSLKPIRIHAGLLAPAANVPAPGGVGSGFSAGIDSFAVLHDHYIKESRPGYRITHLLFNNVGSHGDRDFTAARTLFHQRHEAVRGYPAELGLEFIKVDSNLSDILCMDFERTHTPRNLSVALLFQNLFSRYYYASTFQYRDCFVGETFDMAFTDPFAVHLLSTETLDCLSTGSQLSRVEKTRNVAAVPGAERWLNVCTQVKAGGRNCSSCVKCCRTLMTLELLGKLDAFAGVFDLGLWNRLRNRYVSTQVLDRWRALPLTREIRDYAESTGHRFTTWQRAASSLTLLPRPVLKLGQSIRRRYLGGP